MMLVENNDGGKWAVVNIMMWVENNDGVDRQWWRL